MFLSPDDHKRIEGARAAAAAMTRGDIVCVVANEASPYMEVPLAWAAAVALVAPGFLLILGTETHLDHAFGGWNAGHIAPTRFEVTSVLASYALLQGLLFVAIALVASIPGIRRALTPASVRHGHVHQRALEQFFARDLHKADEHSSVLIYASLKDRCAEVIADTGINSQVDPLAWNEVIATLVAGMRAGKPSDGFVAAIERSGRLLQTHFPAQHTNAHEASDRMTETANI